MSRVLTADEIVERFASVEETLNRLRLLSGVGFTPMPPAVAKALSQVMAGAKMLEKGERNPFANYKYAGVDAFLEMLRPLCAEAGLIVIQDEEAFEFREGADKSGKVLTWLVMTYSFGLAHASGETWPHRVKRTGMVQASMGSQAFGAAQSYALKSFLRSIGLIATGDAEDADSHEQRELPAIAKTKPKTKAEAREDGVYTRFEDGIRACTTREELEAWGKAHAAEIEECPDSWVRSIRTEYARHLASLA